MSECNKAYFEMIQKAVTIEIPMTTRTAGEEE